jgi:hypothetical protein
MGDIAPSLSRSGVSDPKGIEDKIEDMTAAFLEGLGGR